MSIVDTLTTARQGAADKLAEALRGDYSKAIEFKPDFNAANSIQRSAYIRELRETIKDLTEQITTIATNEVDGPYLGTSIGLT